MAALPIEGNEDIINEIRRGIPRASVIPIRDAKSITDYVSAVRSRGGRVSGDYAVAERQRRGDGRDDTLYLGQSSDASGNRPEVGGNGVGSEDDISAQEPTLYRLREEEPPKQEAAKRENMSAKRDYLEAEAMPERNRYLVAFVPLAPFTPPPILNMLAS